MANRIDRDLERFQKIVKGKIRDNLKEYISHGDILGHQGKKTVSIPVTNIDLPHFKYGKDRGGVGQGEGEEGDILKEEGDGKQAGDQPGEHAIETEITIEDLVDVLAEELQLPRIEPKGKKNIIEEVHKYTGISMSGPESLRHNKRTFKQALKRQIAIGNYDPDKPVIMPEREDKRYRSRKTYRIPKANAAIFYILDVSGSMGDEQKDIVRRESYIIDTWLRKNYDGLESRYLIHDAQAQEVDEHIFFHTKESGGTVISSAYELLTNILDKDYSFSEWNIYGFQFSDGDNSSGDDSKHCMELLKEHMLPRMNQFCYGQIDSRHGSGEYMKYMKQIEAENLVLSQIKGSEGIMDSIKEFFNKGK